MKKKKRIFIAYTGGTIGMEKTASGYAPAAGFLKSQLNQIPELNHESMPAYEIEEFNPLLDSSNIMPEDWFVIAHKIRDNYDDFDGFIVLHGTDTMSYTSSALSFMFEGLHKPVIITGSQIPLCEIRNDARDNIITSLQIAAKFSIPEVCLYFDGLLLRGCRSVKVDAQGFQAFDSPNYPPLGRVGVHIQVNRELFFTTSAKDEPLGINDLSGQIVGALRLFPGISAAWMENALQPPLKGLVLEAFGVGNGPHLNKDFLQVVRRACDRGVVIVDCTQCLKGSVNLRDYVTGSVLAEAGVISGLDMTTEAALAKLFYLFKKDYSIDVIKRLMKTNLRGELTPLSPS
jgi:L-asparaginase